MQDLHQKRELKIVGYSIENTNGVLSKKNEFISFKYDKWTNGRIVALSLNDIDIYIEHDELLNLLIFLLKNNFNAGNFRNI